MRRLTGFRTEMNNKPCIGFSFEFIYDGTSTSVSINLSSGPVVYQLPGSSGTNALGTFNATASGTSSLSCDSGFTVTSSTLILGILTVNLGGTPPAAGTICTVSGIITY